MALSISRHETAYLKDFPAADLFGTSLTGVVIEQDFYDHPYPKFSLLLHQVRSSSDPNDNVISRVEEWWDYDETSRAKLGHRKDVYAWGFIPGVTNQPALVLVEQEKTVFLIKNYFIVGGTDAGRVTTRCGYVLYDQHPTTGALTTAQQARITALGKKAGSTLPNREIIDSARKYASALSHQRIVYDANAPQKCVWKDPTEIEIVDVQEDWQKIITTTIKKDCLHEGPPEYSRTEQHKDGMTSSLPIELEPPKIKATSTSNRGVMIEINGGGGSFTNFTTGLIPTPFEQPVSPESYIIFRRTTAAPAPSTSNDFLGIYVDPPDENPQGLARVVENVTVTDYNGNPIDPHPPQVSYAAPEDPTPPVQESWTQVAQVPNAAKDERFPGTAIYYDEKVDTGFTYEYFAVAVLGTAQSGESNHATITYLGPNNTSSGLTVVLKTKAAPTKEGGITDGAVTIEITGPSRDGVADCYGRTRSYDPVRASFDTEASAIQFGTDVGQRQFAVTSPGPAVNVKPTAILFELERGMLTNVPALTWDTWGNALHLSSTVRTRSYYLNGFSWTVAMDATGILSSEPGDLILAEL